MAVAVVVLFGGVSFPVARATGLLFAGAVAITLVQVLAYALCARWSEVPLYGMYLGGGPRLVGFETGGLALELRAIPVGGTVAVHPEDSDPWEAEDPPAHAMVLVELAAPLASLALAVLLLGRGANEAIGLVPAQLWA